MNIAILIHSSKTMRAQTTSQGVTTPLLLHKTEPLAAYIKTLRPAQLQNIMGISATLARQVHETLSAWNSTPSEQSLAIDSFVGDIYSGLQASSLSASDRDYAQQTLWILSGLYGVLRPYDGLRPYRLEMGYKLPRKQFSSLYAYWGSAIAEAIPSADLLVNLSAAEYTKTVLPYIKDTRVIAPRFLTINQKTGKPGQVVVHTKIARGAFARWLITSRSTSPNELTRFSELNYHYDDALSTPERPTFVCKEFGGIGLSIRLKQV